MTKHAADKIVRGSRKGASKLTEEQIPKIRQMLDKGASRQFIANKFNVHKSIINRIAWGTGWSHA